MLADDDFFTNRKIRVDRRDQAVEVKKPTRKWAGQVQANGLKITAYL